MTAVEAVQVAGGDVHNGDGGGGDALGVCHDGGDDNELDGVLG